MARQRLQSDRFARDRGEQAEHGRRDSAEPGERPDRRPAGAPGAQAGGRDDRSPMGFLRRWPPVLWILVYIGSVFILNGSNGKWDPLQLVIGIGLAMIAFGLGMYLAFGPWPGAHPRTREMTWLVAGVAAFYAICTLAAVIFAGFAEAVATLLAGIIPMTGAALWVATTRGKTLWQKDRPEDAALGADDDPFPGVGIDDERPLGDTPEAHGEITPHDLPKDHPGRHEAERQAEALGGTTPGHREGGAAARAGAEDAGDDALVGPDEEDGARVRR
jgi:hypothetical protein